MSKEIIRSEEDEGRPEEAPGENWLLNLILFRVGLKAGELSRRIEETIKSLESSPEDEEEPL